MAGLPLLLPGLALQVGVRRDGPNLLILSSRNSSSDPASECPCLLPPAKNKRLNFLFFSPQLGRIQLLEAPLPCTRQLPLPTSSPCRVLGRKVGRKDKGVRRPREALPSPKHTISSPGVVHSNPKQFFPCIYPRLSSPASFLFLARWGFQETVTHRAEGWLSPSVC